MDAPADELEHDEPFEPSVACLVDHSHAASTDLPDDFVASVPDPG